MARAYRFAVAFPVAASMCASAAFGQIAIQPVPNQPVTKPAPTKPGDPQIQPVRPPVQPPRPPKPGDPQIQPIRPPVQPPKPVRPRPPQYNPEWNWNHHYRPPHWIGWNQAILFSGLFGGGNYLTVRQNIPDLQRFGFHNRVRSMYTTGRWVVCSKKNYRGNCRTVSGRQGTFSTLNGKIRSIRFIGR